MSVNLFILQSLSACRHDYLSICSPIWRGWSLGRHPGKMRKEKWLRHSEKTWQRQRRGCCLIVSDIYRSISNTHTHTHTHTHIHTHTHNLHNDRHQRHSFVHIHPSIKEKSHLHYHRAIYCSSTAHDVFSQPVWCKDSSGPLKKSADGPAHIKYHVSQEHRQTMVCAWACVPQ